MTTLLLLIRKRFSVIRFHGSNRPATERSSVRAKPGTVPTFAQQNGTVLFGDCVRPTKRVLPLPKSWALDKPHAYESIKAHSRTIQARADENRKRTKPSPRVASSKLGRGDWNRARTQPST